MSLRPRLGINLQDVVLGALPGTTGSPLLSGVPGVRQPAPFPSQQPAAPQRQQAGFFKEGGMGRNIAGILGDTLLQQAGMAPVYAPMQQQRQQMDMAEAQWSRRREADNQDWQARKEWELANTPDIAPAIRDAQAWQQMTPEQRQAYQEMREAQAGPIMTTLPNGQFYTGPKSGLAEALGAGAAAPSSAIRPGTVEDGYRFKGGNPADPNAWEPVSAGGPSQPATGGFPGGRR